MSEEKMAVRVEEQVKVDPFYLFLNLIEQFGEGQVFLLDAAEDASHAESQMSMLGVLPAVEICVKNGITSVYAWDGLDEYLARALRTVGHDILDARVNDGESVVSVRKFTSKGNPLALLEDVRKVLGELTSDVADRPFSGGFLGYIGYDAAHYLESLPKTTIDDRQLADIRLQWHIHMIHLQKDSVSNYSHANSVASILAGEYEHVLSTSGRLLREILDRHLEGTPAPFSQLVSSNIESPPPIHRENITQDEFEQNVLRAKEYICAGDVFQLVLSKRIEVEKLVHHYVAYERLRRQNPSPYMFFAEYPTHRIFGTSPEVQFRAVSGVAHMRPIAGTSKGRGKTRREDEQLIANLLADEKERAEHLMLVDLCRNDLGRVCEVGSVQLSRFMTVEPYRHLFHLVSTVEGRLCSDVSVFEALIKTFPAGTLSGAPKIRAMEIIDELESVRRGPYGGMIGMIDFEANANTAIVIRSVVETQGKYYVQVGAGIVADSDETQEWLECGHKSRAILEVLTTNRE